MKVPKGSLRVGCDILDIARLGGALRRGGPDFASTLFTGAELASANDDLEYLSRLFAVKEAAIKTLGIGLACGISLLDFEVAVVGNDASPSVHPALLRHAVTWLNPCLTATAVAVTAYSWRLADHVYARAYLDTGAIPS
jgi:holo-[acyl-carrier-protein] synthase